MTGSKYEPLGRYLANISFTEWRATFSEIEKVLGFSLPPSARTYAAWWGNDRNSHSQASAWLEVGWKAAQVDVGAARVVFCRELPVGRTPRYVPGSAVTQSVERDVAPYPWDEAQALECRIGFRWQPFGTVTLGEHGGLVFPNAAAIPAIYRFRIRHNYTDARYIGETENLSRRFGHYRNPGLTQQTNIRINARFLEVLVAGAEIGVSTVSAAWIDRGLGTRSRRPFIESGAAHDRKHRDLGQLWCRHRNTEPNGASTTHGEACVTERLRSNNPQATGSNESPSWWRWKR
jgi:hypothetical protein